MSNDLRTQNLLKQSHRSRENAENAIVSATFDVIIGAYEPIEVFATWLLVAAGAIASFLIINVEKVLPIIKQGGFLMCGAFLVLSCIFGLMAKAFALKCKIGIEMNAKSDELFLRHLEPYLEEEGKLKAHAESMGINLESEIRVDRVFEEILSPMPRWVVWLTKRGMTKHKENPQIAYLGLLKSVHALGWFVFFQIIAFLAFLAAGFIFAVLI